jgi:biotin operon repressor
MLLCMTVLLAPRLSLTCCAAAGGHQIPSPRPNCGIEKQRQVIQQAGGAFTAEEVAEFLGITRQAVDKRRTQGQLIGLTQGRRGYAYPAFQFEDGKTLQGLDRVVDALRDHDPWMQLIFFVNGDDRSGGESGLEVLRAGRVDAVALAAEGYGERGTA